MARYGRLAEMNAHIESNLRIIIELRDRVSALEQRVTKLEALAGEHDEPICEPIVEDERYGDPDGA